MHAKMMSIEEVDKILALQERPSKKLAYIPVLAIVYFWVVGYGSLIIYFKPIWSLLSVIFGAIGQLAAEYIYIIIAVITAVFLIMFLTALVFLKLVAKLARELLIAYYILMGVIFLAGGAVSIVAGVESSAIVGIVLIVIGLLIIVFLATQRKRINLVGRLIEVSGKAVYDEKGAISAVVVKSLLIFLTTIAFIITEAVTYLSLSEMLQGHEYQMHITVAAMIITALFGIWTITFIDAFFSAAVVRITHDWYRSPEVDVASFSKGLSKAWEVSGPLAKYSLMMALLYLIVNQARKQSRTGKPSLALNLVAAIAGVTAELIEFFGFYVIPAMVIRKAGFKSAFKDSFNKLRNFFIETLAARFGFGSVLGFIAFITAVLMGGVGWLIGVAIFVPMLGLANATLAGVAFGAVFFVIALIPIAFVTSAVSVAFKTILYEYGLDIEFAMKGTILPARLPSDVREIFNKTLAEKGLQIPQVVSAPKP